MKIHSKTRNHVFFNSTALEEVEAFTCLGSVADTIEGTDADIRSRINNNKNRKRTTKHTTHRLQTFINICLRRMLNIWWNDKVNNVDLVRIST